LQSELSEVKQSLSKLQMFTMETNQKLIATVFNNNSNTNTSDQSMSLKATDFEKESTLEEI
jgi:hypothetical protein